MDRLNILVLHALGNPAAAPAFLNHHVFSLRRNFPDHNYLYHDATLPLPAYVRDVSFDAIILDVTFLTARWAGEQFYAHRKSDYAFVRDASAVKLAFPQDEYDCHALLDDWMCDWNVDVVFSVISAHWDVLYPRYHKTGVIRLGYTGYIDESLISRASKPFSQRTIDIGYRAKKLPPYFGRLGETKWTIGRDVAKKAAGQNLHVDIELGDQGTICGEAWFDFIANSKFTLGANSGSSLLDPVGGIQRNVKEYFAANPSASFEEVERNCFPGEDGRYSFSAISPRVLEAALLGSAQILVDGEYSGVVAPGEHFIPIRADANNFADVVEAMKDVSEVEQMIGRCRDAVLSVDALRYKNKARMTLEIVGDLMSQKRMTSNHEKVATVIARYSKEMQSKYRDCWRRQAFRSRVIRAVSPYPVLYNALRSVSRAWR